MARLEAGYASAVRAAQNPGEASRTSALPVGVTSAADMTDEERQLVAGLMMVMMAGQSADEHKPPAGQDPSLPQFFRAPGGSTVVALPDARRTS